MSESFLYLNLISRLTSDRSDFREKSHGSPESSVYHVAEHLCLAPRTLRTDGRATGMRATCVTSVVLATVPT